jgi:hypothetical protein
MGEELKGVICVIKEKIFRKLPMKTWYEKQGILIIEKDKGMPEKKD